MQRVHLTRCISAANGTVELNFWRTFTRYIYIYQWWSQPFNTNMYCKIVISDFLSNFNRETQRGREKKYINFFVAFGCSFFFFSFRFVKKSDLFHWFVEHEYQRTERDRNGEIIYLVCVCVCLCLYGWIVYCCLFVFLSAAVGVGVVVVVLFYSLPASSSKL